MFEPPVPPVQPVEPVEPGLEPDASPGPGGVAASPACALLASHRVCVCPTAGAASASSAASASMISIAARFFMGASVAP